MQNPVLVTGATGILGRAIVQAAIEAGVAVRQGVRTPAKAKPDAEAVHFDYADPATIEPALAGVSAVVLIAPPLESNAAALVGPVIAAAKAAGVGQIILISFFGAEHNEQAPLRVIEHFVMESETPFTILRPNFFMENFSEGFLAGTIREQNAIYLGAGDGRTSFISVRDIAAAVVAALQESLLGEFELTGTASFDHAEVAKMISDVTGRPVVYHSLPEEEMLAGARSHGMPENAVSYLGALYGAVRAGFTAGVSRDFEKITGRAPVTFEEFARESAAVWK